MFCDHLGDPCGAKREDEKTYKTTPADEQAAKASDWQLCKQTAVKGLISSKAGAQEQACEAIAEVFSKCGQGGEHQLWAWKSRTRERERGEAAGKEGEKGGRKQKWCRDGWKERKTNCNKRGHTFQTSPGKWSCHIRTLRIWSAGFILITRGSIHIYAVLISAVRKKKTNPPCFQLLNVKTWPPGTNKQKRLQVWVSGL